MNVHFVLHAPHAATAPHADRSVDPEEFPLDRAAHEALADAVLGDAPDPRADPQLVALQLAGAARVIAEDLRRAADRLPPHHGLRALTDMLLEATARATAPRPPADAARCARDLARLVRALYARLDRLATAVPAPVPAPVARAVG
ncbi:restriction endonuclease [Streptomyces sp. NPDC048507]|uniref:restriction endonuclease n=1 Tax=Streptomyces sp. NPDC048507 TaxID=3365560 RepID=UPI0037201E59